MIKTIKNHYLWGNLTRFFFKMSHEWIGNDPEKVFFTYQYLFFDHIYISLAPYFFHSTIYAATWGGLSISTDGGTSFSNRTTAQGLGNNAAVGVYVVGSMVYVATIGGSSISTDGGGARFTNRTTANGLGSNIVLGVCVLGVYVLGSTVYAALQFGGLSIGSP